MKKYITYALFIIIGISCKKKEDYIPVLKDGYMRARINGKLVDGFKVDRSYMASKRMCIDGLIINEEGTTSKEILIYVNTSSIDVGTYKVGGYQYKELGTFYYAQVDSGKYVLNSHHYELDSGTVIVMHKNINSITGTFEFTFRDYQSGLTIPVTDGEFIVPTY